MSNLVLPSLAGLQFGMQKTPIWSTQVQNSASGLRTAVALYTSPLYRFSVSYEFLRSHARHGEFQALYGLFQSLKGRFDTFLYEDPDDHRAENEVIGVGDGVQTTFVLSRTYCGLTEVIANADAASITTQPTMWNEDGSVSMWGDGDAPMWQSYPDLGPFSINGSLITFETPPPIGLPVHWSGQFYYRCALTKDEQSFRKFMARRWDSSLEFEGDLSGKIQ